MTGKQRCRFCQRGVIMPRRDNGPLATHEFHAPALPDAFRLAKQNAADLAGVLDVSPAARRQIKVANSDEAQFGLVGLRRLTQSKLLRRCLSDIPELQRTILLPGVIRP